METERENDGQSVEEKQGKEQSSSSVSAPGTSSKPHRMLTEDELSKQ